LSWSKHKSLSAASIVHTYKVTTTADTTPASCPATVSEPCTLRQAVIQANTDGTLDKIQVPGSPSPYLLETDQLSVTDPAGLIISGEGQAKTIVEADTTSSSYPFRVLQVSNGSAVQISNITIEEGHSSTSTEDGNGGGIEVLSGSLTMRNSSVTSNTAENQGGGVYVAGLNSIGGSSGTESQAYLKYVTITGNTALGGGGGLDVEGQAVIEGGSVAANSIRSARFPGPDGAGIRLGNDGDFYPSLAAADLTVAANSGSGRGGGIFNGGSLRLSGGAIGGPSLADRNSANDGGGLDNAQVAVLDNVAVNHNLAASFGGGVHDTDRLSMTGGTLSANRATTAGGLDDEEQANLQNVAVSANKASRFAGGLELNGSSLAVSGGSIAGNSAPDGAGVFNNLGTTTINGTSITKNTAALEGGGIFSRSPLTLTRVQLGTTSRPNVAQDGGGLYTVNVGATIVRSRIEGNQARNAGAGSGGGIFNSVNADVELDRTTLTGNSSDRTGGAITNFGATMTISATTLSDNQVIAGAGEAFGGGISNMFDAADGPATLTMINDTVTGNQAGGGATAGFGGGLDNQAQASATLTNVTLSRNRAGSTGTGGGIYNNGDAALRGTILAGNTAAHAHANCGLPVALTSNGYNLSSDTTCGLNGVGDQTDVNPLLGPLANNGGPTETEALKVGSPAVDAVEFCPPPKTDQRGVNRQGPCDVGAFERVPDR
jgi:CSLREA domain-containing protein